MTQLSYSNGYFTFRCAYADRDLPKRAGFWFDSITKRWCSDRPGAAVLLREFADSHAKIQLDRLALKHSPWSGPLAPSPKGYRLYDFQRKATLFALSRNRSYLALDPGLGKTPIAAVCAATLACPTMVICPPFLTRNTEIEFERWYGVRGANILRVDAGQTLRSPDIARAQVLILPDSIVARPTTREVVLKWLATFGGADALLVIDEAHRYKTPTAKRTMHVLGGREGAGLTSLFPRQIYLSGTPMLNRPVELFTILNGAAPETIDYMDYATFGKRYCGGFYDGYGWDFSGASHLDELRKRVHGRFMLRVRKSEVLTELPPKTEEVVIIGREPPKLVALERKLLRAHSTDDLMKGEFSEHVSAYRKELGVYKAKPALEFIKDALDDSDGKLIVYAYHKEVIRLLAAGLTKHRPFVVTGATPMSERHAMVAGFQNVPSRRLFIGNYLACGVGITLTKANRVIFVEQSWVDAENQQASDRAHRIGQLANVLVQYLCYENSIDTKVMEVCLRKRKTTSQI